MKGLGEVRGDVRCTGNAERSNVRSMLESNDFREIRGIERALNYGIGWLALNWCFCS